MTRLLLIVAITCANAGGAIASDQIDFFERNVRPLLVAKCGDCHGAENAEGQLTLTTTRGIAAGGATGAAVVPGKVDVSRLIQAVRYTSKLKMPPDEKLSVDEIAVFERWVRDGATLPGATVAMRPNRSSGVITDEDRGWWSFQPIARPSLPRVTHDGRIRTGVDHFVLRKLEERGLTLSPDADRRSLIRRITFDLIGLPPTPDEVEAFLVDARPGAYARLVDRLLASPQYGVRWGRHWLDVARYADTNGGGFDYVYPNAWRYRDYVVNAFNGDKPYDEFLIEQLAGDLLPPGDDEAAYIERLTATGLLTLAPKGLGMQDKQLMRLDVVDDQVDVLGRSLLGLTLSCARCHDHKFDPIPTADYYALAGIFHSTTSLIDTDKNPSYWPERPLEFASVTAARKAQQTRQAANEKAIAEATKAADADVIARARERVPDYFYAAARLLASRRHSGTIAHWPFDASEGSTIQPSVGPVAMLSNVKGKSPHPTRVDGKFGRGLKFAGKGDVVSVHAKRLGAFDFGRQLDFTVSFWLRAEDGYSPATADTVLTSNYGTGAMWFVALRPGAYNGIYLRHYDGKRAIDIKPAQNCLPKLVDNEWHHVVFTSDRDGQGVVYLDGESVGETSIAAVSSVADYAQATKLLIGASTNQFRGELDEVTIRNYALAPGEVQGLTRADGGDRDDSPADFVRFTAADVSEMGLVPAIANRFTDLLARVEPGSPLHSLTTTPLKSAEEVDEVVRQADSVLQKLFDDEKASPFVVTGGLEQHYASAFQASLDELASEKAEIVASRVPDPVMAMVAFDGAPADLRVHIAGNHNDLGAPAPRGFPQVLPSEEKAIGQQSGRLELARWLVRDDQPLTARVFVNRVWQHHFGAGLVRTPDNFGRLGELPSHPELLDWLASCLIDGGWSVKQLHREIVLSSTYRQASAMRDAAHAVDSGNRWLWRMNRRRLEGEPLRDAMLAVSKQLDLQLGGTVNTWKPKMFSVDDANKETANFDTRRRSIYLPVIRGAAVHEMLQLFDFGDPNSITARRDVTTVAPQALFLMNSPFVHEQAQRLAERLEAEAADSTSRIQWGYRNALGRDPTDAELRRAQQLVADVDGWRSFCQLLLCLNEFTYVD